VKVSQGLLSFLVKCLPTVCIAFLILCGCSMQMGGAPLLPVLYLIPVYYWLVFRPTWLPIVSLLGIGFFYDALMGRELGFSSAILLFSALGLPYVRVFITRHVFYLMWGLFCVYSLVVLCLYGLSGGILFRSWIYGISLYPLIAWCLSHFHVRCDAYV